MDCRGLLAVGLAGLGLCVFADEKSVLTDAEKEKLWVLTGHRDEAGVKRAVGKIAALTPELCRKYAIREAVLLWDGDYDFNWVTEPENVRSFFTSRGVRALTVAEATSWIDGKIAGAADGTSVIMGNGLTPKSWLTKPWSDSRIVRYLKAGGRIVWPGDVLFCYAQGEDGGVGDGGGTFGKGAFRLDGYLGMRVERSTMYGNYTNGTMRTEKAKAWGLECGYGLVRPVLNDGILDPFTCAKDGSLADSGQICLKCENPLSGIVLLSGTLQGGNAAALRDVWRCAWWSGAPVKVPEPSAKALAETTPPELVFGSHGRTVFLRGEQVPVGVRLNGARGGEATLRLLDAKGVALREWTGTISTSTTTPNSYDYFSFFDLRGLRRDVYTAELTLGGRTVRSELRVVPPVDKKGLSVSMWTDFSTSRKRMRNQFEKDILAYGLEPMPTGTALAAAYDWALWCGVPFVARRMPDSTLAWAPEGYDNWMRLSDGSIRPVLALGKKPVSRGYDNPFRRQMQADIFREMGEFDAAFPAYRGVTFTADDYSQWFGNSWNRFAVEGFRNRYGIELPRGANKAVEGAVMDGPATGVVPDDDPAVLAARWFSETHADAAKRSSAALAKATGGFGKAAPIPGAMQIPMNMWSMMNPAFGFGKDGWSQASFYYYNTYWQPFTANAFWTAAARMGDRTRTVWVMPDCYTESFESYYEQNVWNLLAAGAQGLGYFRLVERKDASKKALRLAGGISRHFGVYLNALEPMRAKSVQIIPFENMVAVPERWHQSVILWSNLVLAGIDVDPVAADEDWETAEAAFLLNVRTLTESSFAHLKRFMARGGKAYIDAESAKAIPHDGMTVVPTALARFGNADYDADAVREEVLRLAASELAPYGTPRGVYARRYVDRLGNRVCWFVDTPKGEIWKAFYASTRNNKKGDATLETKGGYGKSFDAEIAVREPVGPIAWDVLGRKALDFRDGRLAFGMSRWGGKLVAFLPESPAPFTVVVPKSARPGVPFEVTVETSGKCVVPFTVSAVDPEGNVSKDYRARLLSDASGRVKAVFDFAVNDLPGTWTFRVTNEFTGETQAIAVCLH